MIFFQKKVSQCRKYLKGDPLGVCNIHSVAKHQKLKGPFGGKNFFGKKVSQCQKKTEKGDPLGVFNIHSVAKHQKTERTLWRKKFSEKSLTMPKKKLKKGTLWDFSTSILSQNIKKMKGPFGGKTFFGKKVSQCRKETEKWDPLVSPGIVCYATKEEKLFWPVRVD